MFVFQLDIGLAYAFVANRPRNLTPNAPKFQKNVLCQIVCQTKNGHPFSDRPLISLASPKDLNPWYRRERAGLCPDSAEFHRIMPPDISSFRANRSRFTMREKRIRRIAQFLWLHGSCDRAAMLTPDERVGCSCKALGIHYLFLIVWSQSPPG